LFNVEPLTRTTISENSFFDCNKLSPEAVKISPNFPHSTSFNQAMLFDTLRGFGTSENFVDFPADTTEGQRYSSHLK